MKRRQTEPQPSGWPSEAELARRSRTSQRTSFRRAVAGGTFSATLGSAAILIPTFEQSKESLWLAGTLGFVAVVTAQIAREQAQTYQADQAEAEYHEDMSRFGHFEA